MAVAYIALGSNLNTPAEQLNTAVKAIAALPQTSVEKVSSYYGSKPMGPQDQPDYVNAVLQIQTELSPPALLDELQRIENEQGRVRLRRWGERTLDLDILLYDNLEMQSERLTIPHYDMQNREFVIVPLAEIAPERILPDGKTVAELMRNFAHHQMKVIAPSHS
ncbi:2-amino-4-hydroxy-6-hydroxymethyldihydropteridine diphosphokinase [Bisgaard Taxon 10/6]|uniref:2-amino-4-hydroxy-6-hydroxymethyldihydropteridine pyrophosphokinase n=1 Tax=Exercitatus varius TaxID=67857 RepID=A0AAW6QBB4_9PAST|nr:2-amino-4-hydroxy-6-hydroxymethyldihydropteridine diphosphokinase [Exercitatus varius]MDG2914759.1 2-amino-4-hydroxy-6-hydroxymethyldihydropteridine diphosphokinase [Exercitatus varius]MDG2917807.1 2-amino-4-hydroxy-6-hydroxymethyldihydropteridine diphosphokinase [Exercitatus varius]MDG2942458.1 2-amino-4-hydroxy-6-hydroxymethyldihydropteridine diphosphokinase [Exercitatus varius]MDG2950598.1 2-amino-4-hydroxy-6-hydroxymethyldihydropteridine diphosphokinase [Exercitatus varius]MDG2962289.1 